MTIHLSRSFLSAFILAGVAGGAAAGERGASIEILSGGKSFASYEAYAAFKADPSSPGPAVQEVSAPAFTQDVLGVTSSLGQVLHDFQGESPAGRPLCPNGSLAEALEQAAGGKQGPLLLVADENKVRIMELKHEDSSGTAPGTNP